MFKKLKYLFLFVIFISREILRYNINSLIIPFRFNIYKFFKFKLDKNFNPYDEVEFKNFVDNNKRLWKNSSIFNHNKSKKILVTSFIHSHAGFSFQEALISKYLSLIKKKDVIGLIRKQDIKSEVVFRSFGIKDIIYFDELKLSNRFKFFLKTFKILENCKTVDDFLKIEINGINFGKAVYEHLVRYTGQGTFENINFKFYYLLSKSLYIEQVCKDITKQNFINSVIQSECQFIPYSIIFQFFLLKKYKVYARHGAEKKLSVRVFSNSNEAFTLRTEVSKDIFEYVLKNFKQIAIRGGELHLNKRFSGSLGNQDTGSSKIAHKNKKDYTKSNLCELFGWDVNKKIACIYSHSLIDGNYLSGWRIFKDNLTWLRKTLNYIKNRDEYNWLIKPHPIEIVYVGKSKTDTIKEFKLLNNLPHIKLVPKNISNQSLLNFTDLALTGSGSAALEYTSFGKKSLMAGRSYFTDILFKNKMPRTEIEYFNLLSNPELIEDISQEQIENAKIYTFIQWNLNLVDHPLNPDKFEPSHLFNEKKFWIDVVEKMKNYKEEDDYFKEMLAYQFKNNLRHTPNLKVLNYTF